MRVFVKELIPNAFSSQQADILKKVIEDGLENNETVELDFSGIGRFTTLFFNFSTGVFITKLGPSDYRKRIKVENLSELGKSTYYNSFENAAKKFFPDKSDEILEVLKNPEQF